jgi:hypothetical protein
MVRFRLGFRVLEIRDWLAKQVQVPNHLFVLIVQ